MSEAEKKKRGVWMMIFATLFWGFMGISNRYLNEVNFQPIDIAFTRSIIGAILTTIFLLITNRSAFKVTFKGFMFCALYGIINYSIGISLYSLSVERIPIGVATVLMFSNPIWVTLLNYIFFKEKISFKKMIVILTCIFGCMCIIDIFSTGGQNLDLIGITAGVLDGVTFALQIVMPRFVEKTISKDSILLYGFWSSAICLIFFADIPRLASGIINSPNPLFYFGNVLSIGVLSTFVANTFYVNSTKYIGTSLPSMMVALEPTFATVLAFFIFGESMKPIQILGTLIVIGSVMALELNFEKIMNRLKGGSFAQ
ncbi:membrane protein [Peptostreptococcus russellii]|uniref:Membrane protein n=1 Tax=Peptostreptococcus russellii TaxID=215200 RepID=A0A2P7PZT5_9FIRM|nr:EamA family transporter [Peptostreptococcus russellii]PSJ31234.1 membrane protein [Peptostreptococcus russellii]